MLGFSTDNQLFSSTRTGDNERQRRRQRSQSGLDRQRVAEERCWYIDSIWQLDAGDRKALGLRDISPSGSPYSSHVLHMYLVFRSLLRLIQSFQENIVEASNTLVLEHPQKNFDTSLLHPGSPVVLDFKTAFNFVVEWSKHALFYRLY